MDNISTVAEQIITIARKKNCRAQVTLFQSRSKEILLRKGEIEQSHSSQAIATGIRLFKGKKTAIVSFSGDDFINLEAKLTPALENLQYLGEDENKRLLTLEECGDSLQPLELDDQLYEEINTDAVTTTLKTIEAGGLAVSDKIIPSEMAGFSASQSIMHLFSSAGVARSYSKSYYTFSYSAVAEDSGMKEVDSWSERKRFFNDLAPEKVDRIGREAAQRALKRLGGKKIKSGERPVVFSNRTAATVLDLLGDGLSGEAILLKNSFLVGKLGQTLFSDKITIMDDPFIHRFPGSYPFDGEGKNGMTKAVIEKGKLTSYLHNSYSAGRLHMGLTGNASRSISAAPGIKCGNFFPVSGKGNLEDLLHEMKDGLLVEDLFTSGMNNVTGDFSFGCSGFLVENGVATMPVKEITIAGNIVDLFKNILEIADDNLFKSSVSSPSLLVAKLAIAGL